MGITLGNPVLRIFISSTAVDLMDYREKVRDAILGLKNLPIAMETFSAKAGVPASECMKEAAAADAVVCVVAHRYGYVPPVALGGDGEHSITWLEVSAAKKAGKPVFAFVIEPNAPWTAAKEQDRLLDEPDKSAEIIGAVRKLQEFKKELGDENTLRFFKNPDDLATQVATSLAHFVPVVDAATVSTAKVWKPLFCHALQPAPHFRGRATQLADLKNWLLSPVTPDRVLSVVAAGGTGKTAPGEPCASRAAAFGSGGCVRVVVLRRSAYGCVFSGGVRVFHGRDESAGGRVDRTVAAGAFRGSAACADSGRAGAVQSGGIIGVAESWRI